MTAAAEVILVGGWQSKTMIEAYRKKLEWQGHGQVDMRRFAAVVVAVLIVVFMLGEVIMELTVLTTLSSVLWVPQIVNNVMTKNRYIDDGLVISQVLSAS